MADITDIKAILYTEKQLSFKKMVYIVVQTSPRMTKKWFKRSI
jgi:large subunit ribosomal protein L23